MTKEEYQKQIGEKIAELRKKNDMTQSQLAQMCGLSQNHITRIEHGRYNVGLYQLKLIADALGYDIEFIKHKLQFNND